MFYKKQKGNIKLKLMDTDNSMLITRGKGVGGSKGLRGPIYFDGRRFAFGWWGEKSKGFSTEN